MTRNVSADADALNRKRQTNNRCRKQTVEYKTSFSTHQPLFPPGRIIHLVRQHSSLSYDIAAAAQSMQVTYHAIWADTLDFGEVLVSPAMFRDHMPATVLFALQQVYSLPSNIKIFISMKQVFLAIAFTICDQTVLQILKNSIASQTVLEGINDENQIGGASSVISHEIIIDDQQSSSSSSSDQVNTTHL